MAGADISLTPQINRASYANGYERAYRSISKDEKKAHTAAWGAAVAATGGAEASEMERVASLALKDKLTSGELVYSG